MRLAGHLGKTLEEVQGMSWEEFRLWLAFDSQAPIGMERNDYNAALVSMVIAEVNRDRKKSPKPFQISDFLLFLKKKKSKPKQPMTDKEIFNVLSVLKRKETE